MDFTLIPVLVTKTYRMSLSVENLKSEKSDGAQLNFHSVEIEVV